MHLRIKRRYVVICVLIAVVFIASTLFLVLSRNTQIDCQRAKDYFGASSCGFIANEQQELSSTVAGIITEKTEKSGEYSFELATQDANGNTITERVAFPEKNRSVGLTVISRENEKGDESLLVSQKSAYDSVSEGDEVALIVAVPTEVEIREARGAFGDSKFLACFSFNGSYLVNLKTPTVWTKLLKLRESLVSNCPLSVMQLVVYER